MSDVDLIPVRSVCIVRNQSNTSLTIFGEYTLKPKTRADLFHVIEDLTEDQVINAFRIPLGELYVKSEVQQTIVIERVKLVHTAGLSIEDLLFVPPLSLSGNTVSIQPASSTQDGYLTKEDWVLFSSATALPPANATTDGYLTKEDWVRFDSADHFPPADGYHDGYLTKEDWIRFNTGVVMPPADGYTDGYLTKEDWTRFNEVATIGVKPNIKIWQYQDFTGPVSSSLTLSAFQNGTGLVFNPTYILSGTAQIVLASDTSSPPTSTNIFPLKFLPTNRVVVTSQLGTAVTLNKAPQASQNCRVFYEISLPGNIQFPTDYQEDPEFLNQGATSLLDDKYVNQNQDESIYGKKIFEDEARFDGRVGINRAPTADLDVVGLIKTTQFQLTTGAIDGYFLQSDADGYGTWMPVSGSEGAPLVWGNSSILATTTTRYLTPGYTDSPALTSPISMRCPTAGQLKSLRIRHNTTAGNGNIVVYTLRHNNVATLLLVSLASTATDGNNLLDSIFVAAGDLLDIEVTKASSIGTSPSNILATLEIV